MKAPDSSAATVPGTGAGVVRDTLTLTLFAALGVMAFLLNGLGSILVPLQEQLGVTAADVAFYPTLFAVALIAVGLLGGPLVHRLGHRSGLILSIALLGAGAALLASPARLLTLVGAVVLGLGAALSVLLVPVALTGRHQSAGPAVLGEANAVASITSLLAPICVATALGLGWGWRVGYLLPILPVALVVLFLLVRRPLGLSGPRTTPAVADPSVGGAPAPVTAPGLAPGRLAPRLAAVLLAVSVEFGFVLWAARAFVDWHGADVAVAAALSSAFLVGMAVVRALSTPLSAGRHPLAVVGVAALAALAGFVVFWTVPSVAGSAVGLLIAGGGVALMYPLLLGRVVAARPGETDRSSRFGTLMSGLAIAGAPLGLAVLADAVGLRSAYLAVPVVLVLLAAYCLVVVLQDRTTGPTTPD
ncbi:MFS transporter [Nakamurella flava]|uniref:MFS transporter n=1 Tax=Nakamurella flava TaxID=2576308 RepID=A0A4U6QKY5_9ACTN|nr:MFS transporter [Nakamurella flava]TKV61001.1 MFS transporter [Nakamurella flava]